MELRTCGHSSFPSTHGEALAYHPLTQDSCVDTHTHGVSLQYRPRVEIPVTIFANNSIQCSCFTGRAETGDEHKSTA